MKLASVIYEGQVHICVARDAQTLVDIAACPIAGKDFSQSMIDFIELGNEGLGLAADAMEAADERSIIPMAEVEWLPPVPRPGKICGIAMNNSASNERKISAPDHPAFFLKPSSCLVGHGQAVRVRSYYGSVHPEPELAVVIGRRTKDVDAVDALDNVFGYSVFNDITGNGMRAEDLFRYWAIYASDDNPGEVERREQHLSYAGRYKGSDTFGCFGPWLVTRDEVPDPDDLGVICRVGGEVVADDSTRYYNYKVAELVSFVSQFQTLGAGDVISCGTAFKPSESRKSIHHANFQRVSGPVEVCIEGLGTLINPVIREAREIGNWRLSTDNG